MSTHLTVRVMTELPGKTAAEKEKWLKHSFDEKTRTWRHADSSEAPAQEAYYRRKIEKILDSLPMSQRQLIDKPDTLVVITPQKVAEFLMDEELWKAGGVTLPYYNRNIIVLSTKGTPDPSRFEKKVTTLETNAVHELMHVALDQRSWSRRKVHEKMLQACERAKKIAPEIRVFSDTLYAIAKDWRSMAENLPEENSLAALDKSVSLAQRAINRGRKKWHDIDFDFASLGKKKEVAIHIFSNNPKFYTMYSSYKPGDYEGEIVCDLVALSHHYGREAVYEIAPELMDYVDGLFPSPKVSPQMKSGRGGRA